LKAGSCLQCNYALPIVGRARLQKVHNDTVKMPIPGGQPLSAGLPQVPSPPVPAAPGAARKKPAIPPPSRKPLQLGKNAMDGMMEFSVGEVESSMHDDAPVPSVPSVSTADPDLSEIVARSRARSIARSKDQLPPPPPASYDGVPGLSPGPRSSRRRETEQTLRMQAVDPNLPPAPRQSSFMVDLILVLGIITATLVLTTVLILALK